MKAEYSEKPMPNAQDQALADSAAAGDPIAWRTVYDETCQPLFNFLCYQTGNREAARDLLQETYLTAHGKLHTYRGRRAA